MPGAKVWDPTPAGGSLSTARGEQNPSADGASLSSTEVALTRALVSRAGNVGRNIALGGDSITLLCEATGRPFTTVNVTGVGLQRADLNISAGSGTLAWNATARTLTWTAPGDTAGSPVVVTDGFFTLQSGTAGLSIVAGVTSRLLPATNQSDVMTAGAAVWQRNIGSWSGALDALTFGRFNFLNFGISGNTVVDLAARFSQIIRSNPDVYIDLIGTNSVTSNVSATDIAAQRAALWDQMTALGIPVIVVLITPRFAVGSSDEATFYSAAKQNALTGANLEIIRLARQRKGVTTADPFSTTAIQSSGRVRASYTVDGVHGSGGLGYEIAKAIAPILNAAFLEVLRPMTGVAMYYDATYRPTGNLMTSDQGGFAGTGGTAGTGITAGTGLAAGWNAARVTGAAVAAVANKVAATDGGADWQEFTVSGAAVDFEMFRLYPNSISATNYGVGDVLEFGFEFVVIGAGCQGVYGHLLNTGGPMNSDNQGSRAHQLRDIVQGMRDGETGLVRSLPQIIVTGITSVLPTINMQSKAGASFAVRIRSAYVRKVI